MKTLTLRQTLAPLISILALSCSGGLPAGSGGGVTVTRSALLQPICVGDTDPSFNDAPAINAAMSASTEVVLPAGACNIYSVLSLGTGVWLHGQGASTVLRAKGVIAGVIYSGATNAKISDLTIDGNGFSTPGILLLSAQSATLTRMTIKNTSGFAIWIPGLAARTGALPSARTSSRMSAEAWV